MWVSRQKLDKLETRLAELERLVGRLEDRMITWPTQMNDLAEKANTAIRRLGQREARARARDGDEDTGEPVDAITQKILERRSRGRAVSQ